MTDEEIIAEAERQRQHERKLAEITAQTERERLRYENDQKSQRRAFLGVFLGCLAGLLVLGGIIGSIIWNVNDDRNRRERLERNADVAELCVLRGDIWIDGNCVPSRREPGS